MSRVASVLFASKLRIVLTAVVGLVVLVGAAFGAGVLGTPSVVGVENQFGTVTEEETAVQTDMTVNNPNPFGIQLGGTTVNYTVLMNDVRMASGQKSSIQVETGNSTLNFTTRMDNSKIPPWWTSHIRNSERTNVTIDARVTSGLTLGRTVSLQQGQTVETDLIGQFNSEEDRPINANRRAPSDPVLWVNRTTAAWDRDGLTAQRTPIQMRFDVFNPKPFPYAISELGYTMTMNDVTVGEGSTEDVASIPPGTVRTVETRTVIRNQNLDEWWVSHLQNNQVTQFEMQFYVVVDPVEEGTVLGTDPVGEFRIPLDSLSYERTIETDIFGTKADDGTASDDSGDGNSLEPGPDDSESTESDDSLDDGPGSTTDTTTDNSLMPSDGDTESETPTDDGGLLG